MIKISRAHRQIVAALEKHKLAWDTIEWVPFKDGTKRGMWLIDRGPFPNITGSTVKKLCSEDIPAALP